MVQKHERTLEDAFPNIDSGIRPLGNRILVQIRSPMTRTKGGIILGSESIETEMWNEMTAKVISLGPLAFRDRKTLDLWPEGEWVKPGAYVRVPKYGGDRILQGNPGDPDCGLFVIFNDHEIISEVTCNPLDLKTCY